MMNFHGKRAIAFIVAVFSILLLTGCRFIGSIDVDPTYDAAWETVDRSSPDHAVPNVNQTIIFTDRADFAFEEAASTNANGIAEAINGYINALDSILLTPLPHITVNIVAEAAVLYSEPGSIIVSEGDALSRDLVVQLAKTVEGLPEWVYRGAAYTVTDTVNAFKLGSAFAGKDADLNALSLTPVRFASRYNDESQLRRNYHLAAAFLQHIVDKYGMLKTDGLVDDKRDFLSLLAVDATYDCPYDGEFDLFEFEYDVYHSQAEVVFPLFVKTGFCEIYAQPLQNCSDASAFEEFLYKLITGRRQMKAFIEQNADEYLYVCDFDAYTEYLLLNTLDNSYAWRGHIVLSFNVDAVLHETVHQWLMPNMYDHWYFEGAAEYLALQGGEGESLSFVNSMARHALMFPDLYGGLGVADLNNTPAEHRVEGDCLTYDQSCSMIAYIVETYSLDPILALCGGYDYETAFGFPFSQLYDEWVEWLGA